MASLRPAAPRRRSTPSTLTATPGPLPTVRRCGRAPLLAILLLLAPLTYVFAWLQSARLRREGPTGLGSGRRQIMAQAERKNLVILGAVGRPLSAVITRYNVGLHFPAQDWDCMVLSYEQESSIVASHPPHCKLILRPGWQFGDFVFEAHKEAGLGQDPAPYAYVALVLDDVLLDERSFSTDRMMAFMRQNDLHTATPVIGGAGYRWGRSVSINEVHPLRMQEALWETRQRSPGLRALELGREPAPPTGDEAPGEVRLRTTIRGKPIDPGFRETNVFSGGRLVTSAEIFATFYTAEAWRCLAELFWPGNRVFHGFDACYFSHCRARGLERVAVHDGMVAYHTEHEVPETMPPSFASYATAADKAALPPGTLGWGTQPKAAAQNVKKKWAQKAAFFKWVLDTHGSQCQKRARTRAWLLDKPALAALAKGL